MTQKAPFITFEGGEGGGKSTQIKLLSEWLGDQKIPHIKTREPGGSPNAEKIREVLIAVTEDPMDPLCELMLMFAARREHYAKTVKPALDRGEWVLSDRFADSSFAYQIRARGLPEEYFHQLYQMLLGVFAPGLTFVLDLPAEEGLSRAKDPNRFEAQGLEFHQKVREAYLERSATDPSRFVVIDARQSIEEIHQEIIAAVESRYALAA